MFEKIRASASSLLGMSSRWPSARRPGLPHIGKKEQERAKRCWMQPNYGWHLNGDQEVVVKRSPPCMNQISKRQYQARLDCEAALAREAI